MAMVTVDATLLPRIGLERLSGNLTALLQRLSESADIIPKDTLLWKLKLLRSAASYANSRLHAVTAEVLVLSRFPLSRRTQTLTCIMFLFSVFCLLDYLVECFIL
ncbi:unnamed protein product [Coffea canephora]|uniref:Uncharacterized protein n=1 Tax=Coffea canephora TaxID=49390 RepID=A0A068UJX8_COFCA|nr:unnamed protein product [Coffea canephora]